MTKAPGFGGLFCDLPRPIPHHRSGVRKLRTGSAPYGILLRIKAATAVDGGARGEAGIGEHSLCLSYVRKINWIDVGFAG